MNGWPDVNAAPDEQQPATDYFAQSLANAKNGQREFLRRAQQNLAKAQAKTLKPLRDRLRSALAISNEADMKAALSKIREDLPSMLLRINQQSGTARELEKIMGTAIVQGLTANRE